METGRRQLRGTTGSRDQPVAGNTEGSHSTREDRLLGARESKQLSP